MVMLKKKRLNFSGLCLCILFIIYLSPVDQVLAEPVFTSENFKVKWERADKPVEDNVANPERSWLWGPESINSQANANEPYVESPGGIRQVMYFDKARMEINNPENKQVTNGLLVRELISGRMATGNVSFVQRHDANDIFVAGDLANNIGPTYASFNKIVTLNNDNAAQPRLDKPVTDSIDATGTVGTVSTDLGSLTKYVYFDPNLKHNIPAVFWDFMNQKGTIYQAGNYLENQVVLGENTETPWLDVTGLPISEAYWTKVTLAGKTTSVLVQMFERRVLTFTPTNPTAFKVEMGNVGRHYLIWRYNPKYDLNSITPIVPPIKPSPIPPPTPIPATTIDCTTAKISDDTNGAYTYPRCGPAGMEVVLGITVLPNEQVQISPIPPDGSGRDTFVATANDKGVINELYKTSTQSLVGMWSFKYHSLTSNKDAVAYVEVASPVEKPSVTTYPEKITVNSVIAFVAVGFKPGETVTATVEGPDGSISKPTTTTVSDNGGGLTLLFQSNEMTGLWVFKITSADGSRSAMVNFTVVDK